MLKYGTDKPDLRNPLLIHEITEIFKERMLNLIYLKNLVKSGSKVRCIVTKKLKINQEVF